MTNPISDAQRRFITDLLAKRVVPTDAAENAAAAIADGSLYTTRQASGVIDTLKGFPYKPKAPAAPSDPYAALNKVIETIPDAKYAVTRDVVNQVWEGAGYKNELMFLEIKSYRGRRYLNRLVGAPGAFSRYRLPVGVATGLFTEVGKDWQAASIMFAKHYSVCGRCAAELTDDESRRTNFGPTCRKLLGLA